jgi:ribosomal protein S18 acetylase RimI-like enzyme
MTAFTIRKACPDDAAALPAIEQSAGELFATLPDLAWLADEDNKSVATYRALIDGGYCWVATDDAGRRCGFLAAEPMGDTLHICEIAVARDRQGRGIGTALMRTVIRAAAPLRAITLTTFADVVWNAPYYERIGFRRLTPGELGPDLHAILTREAESGLPGRCAMRLDRQRKRAS